MTNLKISFTKEKNFKLCKDAILTCHINLKMTLEDMKNVFKSAGVCIVMYSFNF